MIFQLHIGDWSDDGHGKQQVFSVKTSLETIEEVRDAYWKAAKVSGFSPSDFDFPCNDYQDRTFPKDHPMACYLPKGLDDSHFEGSFEIYDPQALAIMVINWLKGHNHPHHFEIREEDTQTLHNYGQDKKGRHIGHIGYGVFE